jgi:cell division protease FtsH
MFFTINYYNMNTVFVIVFFLYLSNVESFLNTKLKIATMRGIKNMQTSLDLLNTGADFSKNLQDIHFDSTNIINQYVGQPIGDVWTYETLIDNVKIDNVDSVSILTDKQGLIVIDKAHEIGDYANQNLHFVKFLPSSFDNLLDYLSKNNIHVDLYHFANQVSNGPQNIFFDFLKQGASFAGMYFLFIIIINVIRGIFTGQSGMGANPMDFNNQYNKLTSSGQIFGDKDEKNSLEVLTKFSDVAGCEEAKFELQEVVDFLKSPARYEDAGAKIPTGVLLEGNPGTGKTLLARAVAGEAGVPFISASGSEFIEMYVGVGASRVRNLFEKAKKNSPCVVFIDEIDAVGRQRGAGIAGGNDEREQTLNQILTNMDGFEPNDGIIVLAATNRVDILDKALVRPGRFDRKVNVGLPDYDGRLEISKIHFRNKNLQNSTNLEDVAALTSGFSGAELANLANEAAIFSVRKNETTISKDTLFDAFEKVAIGIKSFSQENDKEIIELVSFHEIGHALMVALFKDMFNLRKITINANKNGAGGYTLFTPRGKYEKYPTKKFMLANLIVALGGRAAEIYLGEKKHNINPLDNKVFKNFDNLDITTGASNDLKQAYNLAKEYITTYGFGEEFNIQHAQENELPFLGRDLYGSNNQASKDSSVEEHINNLLKFACTKAYELIITNEAVFICSIEKLKSRRTIDGAEIYRLLEKHTKKKNKNV